MMSEGYAWIMTYGSTAYLNLMDSSTVDAMQGVLSINLYVQKSKKLDNFKSRWKKRFYQENPSVKAAEPGVFGLWAYDTVWALAMAAESAGLGGSMDRKPNVAWTLIKWSQTSPFDIKHNAQRSKWEVSFGKRAARVDRI